MKIYQLQFDQQLVRVEVQIDLLILVYLIYLSQDQRLMDVQNLQLLLKKVHRREKPVFFAYLVSRYQ